MKHSKPCSDTTLLTREKNRYPFLLTFFLSVSFIYSIGCTKPGSSFYPESGTVFKSSSVVINLNQLWNADKACYSLDDSWPDLEKNDCGGDSIIQIKTPYSSYPIPLECATSSESTEEKTIRLAFYRGDTLIEEQAQFSLTCDDINTDLDRQPVLLIHGVALNPNDLNYAPREDLIHPSIIQTTEYINNPLGSYYLYYSPHSHIGVSMAYSDSIEGPWIEYENNPVIAGPAAPDIRWIPEANQFYLWAHSTNARTDVWSTTDGIHFQKIDNENGGSAIYANKLEIGTKNATYTRVYDYPIERLGNRYIMLYSAANVFKGTRSIFLAHSTDALNWVQLIQPLVSPAPGENLQIYGPSLIRWQGKNLIVYQDNNNGNSGGNLKYVVIDEDFTSIGSGGERLMLLNPTSGSPINNRFRGAEFYLEDEILHMYSGASNKGNEVIIRASSQTAD